MTREDPAAPDSGAAAIRSRLKRIEGQVRGIDRVIAEGRPCDEVLIQIKSIKAALDSVALLLIATHMEACVGADTPEQTKAGFRRLLKLLCRAP